MKKPLLLTALPLRLGRRVAVGLLAVMLALASTIIHQTVVRAAAGDLDPTFGNGGKIMTYPGSVNALAIQPDGKIIAAGPAGSEISGMAVTRYNPDGSTDLSFGVGGKAQAGLAQAVATAVALQSDGKIVVGGNAGDLAAQDFALARFNPDGSLDPTFGIGGRVITDFFGYKDTLTALVIQPDGKIAVAGSAFHEPQKYDFALARYDASGNLDVSFGIGGKAVTDFFNNDDYDEVAGMALQADGKIVAAGYANYFSRHRAAVARYTADGSLDPTFGAGGKTTTDFYASGFSEFTALSVQTDGKLVAAGWTDGAGDNEFAVARYMASGLLDPTFGEGGKVTTGFHSDIEAASIALQRNGKIVVGGIRLANAFDSSADFVLARYTPTGELDPQFGMNGIVITDFQGGADAAHALAIQRDGKIIAAGNAWVSSRNRTSVCALARYQGDSPFDMCVQDDSNGNLLQINTTTGDYQFTNCAGLMLGGTGTLTRRGSTITLQHNAMDRRVMATIDTSTGKATASVQLFSQGRTFGIMDRNITNNTCACR
ncbi:MAG TPA: delta-60 repeat domain-containing protein [Blastocatellia bacterium]|nr:delta-60 repeat domain-containing protein [Blastocatellia bacterium]